MGRSARAAVMTRCVCCKREPGHPFLRSWGGQIWCLACYATHFGRDRLRIR
jgi:hypothetical protein